jgi:WD40 repeat protein
VGKTSFVRAGVIASRPEGWAAVHATPGSNPGLGLAQALTPDLAGDAEAIGELLAGVTQLSQTGEAERVLNAAKRWRSRRAEALLVMDQFEELFTLNPPETQARIAALLERLASEADVHVVLSMRDDFLIRCSDHASLAPVYSEITPLIALSQEGLRRAVVEPAKKTGYRFEDDALVEEMVSLVEGDRGALPLLAFAVARLWEKRDRERKLLTREAYQEIAGVEGALAQHAEATMNRIGSERQELVREIFRNLVTAQGTRAVMGREELLSAFPDRRQAEEVLGQLINARLLTSYEVEDTVRHPERGVPGDRAKDLAGVPSEPSLALTSGSHRIEIVHESLLTAWPRLVRWQTQDEDSAQLRDQLKQAAHLWDEKGRTPDLLWSGTAYQEYELWRERYPGKLTAIEEDFSHSMVERARRRRRLRRLVTASVVGVAVVVASVMGLLWLRSEAARKRALAEALRAEASKLLTLAQARLDKDPTEALALTTASLELADSQEARVFAMKTLWEAPPAFEVVGGQSVSVPVFSPDGKWLAASGFGDSVGVWAETGAKVAVLSGHQLSKPFFPKWSQTGLLVTRSDRREGAHVWSFPGGQKVRTIEFGKPSWWQVGPNHLFAETFESLAPDGRSESFLLRSWRLPDGEAQELGRVNRTALGASTSWFEPNGAGWLYAKGRTVYFRPLPADGRGDRVVTRYDSDVRFVRHLENGQHALQEDSGRVHICCKLSNDLPTPAQSVLPPQTAPNRIFPERSGRWLVNDPTEEAVVRLWDLGTWPAARPLVLRRNVSSVVTKTAFHPTGDWFVLPTKTSSSLTFWPLRQAYPTVVDGYAAHFRPLAFTPDSRSLVTSWKKVEGQLRLWPVGEDMREGPRPLALPEEDGWIDVSVGPTGDFIFVVGWFGGTVVVPLDGAPARRLEGFAEGTSLFAAAVSPSGRRVATAIGAGGGARALRVWDLESGEQKRFDLPEGPTASARDGKQAPRRSEYEQAIHGLGFVGESTLYTGGDGGIRRWDLESGTHELVFAARPGHALTMRLGAQGRTALVRQWSKAHEMNCLPAELVVIGEGTVRALLAFGDCVNNGAVALDPSGTVAATGDRDGVVRVGWLGEGEPHLLFGHSAEVRRVAISPDLRWVASAGEDNTIRLWPMPPLDEPPLHTLPHDLLLAKLKSLTNLRAVRDPEVPGGWTIELGPFPGWKNVPTW